MAKSTLANSLGIEGAEVCRVMLSSLSALPRVQVEPDPRVCDGSDDGTRYDYAGADRALAVALDNHADEPGFRRALAHFLLSILIDGQVPSVSALKADEMLSDGGYRPEDALVAAMPNSAGTAEERRELAASASYEIESIALTLQGLDDTTDNWFLMRGLFLRIEALNSVVMSVTGGGDERRELAEMRGVLFGQRANQEAAYG